MNNVLNSVKLSMFDSVASYILNTIDYMEIHSATMRKMSYATIEM